MARHVGTARSARSADSAAEERGAQAIHRALSVIEVFSADRPSATLTEIIEATGLTVPTAHRMVRALQLRGYMTHDPLTGEYSLGSGVMRLAQVVLHRSEQDQVVGLAMPHLEMLRDLTAETVGLHIMIGGDRVCIAELVSHQMVRMASGVGRVYPLHAGAASKALLSGIGTGDPVAALRDRSLTKLTPKTVASLAKLRREIDQARVDGYATSFGETIAGASAIAAPIYGPQGVVAVINIAGPTSRWTKEAMDAAAPTLLQTVAVLSEHLGYRRDGAQATGSRARAGAGVR